MKTNISNHLNGSQSSFLLCMLSLILISIPSHVKPQQRYNISGELICIENGETIAFANIALYDSAQANIVTGAASNEVGIFSMNNVAPGTYNLQVSALGFERYRKQIELLNGSLSLGAIGLSVKNIELQDVDVVSRRIPAKQESGSTTFFVSSKMQESANTGTDILRLLPGVGIDLQQNISLEGSTNIIILVDGKEREGSYLFQLPASKIDKVEVISSPPARYDAGVTGIINVVLSKERDSGWDGHIYTEIPVSQAEVFLTPAYSLNYGIGKVNLFTSYNGDLRRFSITETYQKVLFNHPEFTKITSLQMLTQKTWSHKFHYGIDWYLNDRNQLNFYGFYNPYSQELDGTTEVTASGAQSMQWHAVKNDDDINRAWFHSLWYKHLFAKGTGHEITFEASWYNLNAENSTIYTGITTGLISENTMQPNQQSIHARVDYTFPVSKAVKFNTGYQARLRRLHEKNLETFGYEENIHAGYGTFSYKKPTLEARLGLRTEHVSQQLALGENSAVWLLLPEASVKYNCSTASSLAFNYRRSTSYPGVYQLNPSLIKEDIFTLSTGNPGLQAEKINRIHLEYSRRINNNFLSARLFYQQVSDAIGKIMSVNNEGNFENIYNNLGEMHRAGIQFSGALVIKKAGINPYVKIFNVWSIPNQTATPYLITGRHQLAVESGLSAYVAFDNDFTASATFQYTSPVNNMQETYFSDALYFLSFEKSFANGIKAGIISGLPLLKKFTYQGDKINSRNVSHHSSGRVNLSAVPLWLKISYRFTSGAKRQKIERNKSVPEREIRKGF